MKIITNLAAETICFAAQERSKKEKTDSHEEVNLLWCFLDSDITSVISASFLTLFQMCP